jgi:hypothetical protein
MFVRVPVFCGSKVGPRPILAMSHTPNQNVRLPDSSNSKILVGPTLASSTTATMRTATQYQCGTSATSPMPQSEATGSTQQETTGGTAEPNWVPWPSPIQKTTTSVRYTTGSTSKNPPLTQSENSNGTALDEEIGDVLKCSVQCAQYWFQKAKELFTGDDTLIPMQQCDCDSFPFRSFSEEEKQSSPTPLATCPDSTWSYYSVTKYCYKVLKVL